MTVHAGAGGKGGALEVRSLPSGAQVYLVAAGSSAPGASAPVCATPCVIDDLNRDRVLRLRVEQAGYVPWSALVDLKEHPRDRLTALLRPAPTGDESGYLTIRSRAPAEIYLDGKEIGAVTNEGKVPVHPGSYQLSLVRPRGPSHPATRITVARGATVVMKLP
jgi:hypothetical protein